ncbi:MAG: hypothetical protein WD294_07300 [Phycisphaeraceae bacterium]
MTTQPHPPQQDGLPLGGLDGTNPLGFLAALGVLQTLDSTSGSGAIRMKWQPAHGTWTPVLIGSTFSQESLLDVLDNALAKTIDSHPIRILADLDTDHPSERREMFEQSVTTAHHQQRLDADWLAALGSDIIPSTAINQLQTTRRDYHYGNLTSIINKTTREHLRRAIFSAWDYTDPLDNQSLHLDPSEDRRHAHQWHQPSGDPDKKKSGGMLGANRLAIEAFAWFTSLPSGEALRTVGFTGQRSHNTRWTWPIWNVPLAVPVIRSLLMLMELQDDDVTIDAQNRLRQRGIVAAYRTSRILVGKTPNFTPARRIA